MKWMIMAVFSIASLLAVVLVFQPHILKGSIKIATGERTTAAAANTSTERKEKNAVKKKKVEWKSQLDTPTAIVSSSRDVRVSIGSNWSVSDAENENVCETYGYYLERNTHWDYINELVTGDAVQRREKQEEDALLQYSLSLKAYSPLCELYNGLVQQVATALEEKWEESEVIAVSYPDEAVFHEEIDALIHWAGEKGSSKQGVDVDSILIPGETISTHIAQRESEMPSPSVLVVVYAKSSKASSSNSKLARWVTKLKQSNIPFLLRFFNSLQPPMQGHDGSRDQMLLQGYGVRLDIRNIEYRAFDDAADTSEKEDSEYVHATVGIHPPSNVFLAGVNVTLLTERYPPLQHNEQTGESFQELVQTLHSKHVATQEEMSVIPHPYQRRRLSLQTTLLILQEHDPLQSLQQLSQNLPSYANLLSMTSTSFQPDIIHWTKIMSNVIHVLNPSYGGSSSTPFAFYINGLRINIERPSFNVFELIQTLKEELGLMDYLKASFRDDLLARDIPLRTILTDMSSLFLSDSYKDADSADENDEDEADDSTASSTTTLRIDVGRTTPYKLPIFYINNIERDTEYAQYSHSLQSLLYGSVHVRRNIFHALFILNPFQTTRDELATLTVIHGLAFGQGLPIRIGFLFSGENVDTAHFDTAPATQQEEFVQPHQMMHLIQILSDYYNTETIYSVIKYWMTHVLDAQDHTKDVPDDTINYTHAQVWDILKLNLASKPTKTTSKTSKTVLSEILTQWTKEETKIQAQRTHYYKNTLPFLQEKSLKQGVFFLNGIPISLSSSIENSVNTIIQNDIRFIATAMMEGVINDYKPRSLYSYFLTKRKGTTLYESYHPLLTEVELSDKIYIYYPVLSSSSSHALWSTGSSPDSTDDITSFYMTALYIDFESIEHLLMARQFMDLMDSYQMDSDAATWIGYDVVPVVSSSVEKGGVGSLFTCVRQLQLQASIDSFSDFFSFLALFLQDGNDTQTSKTENVLLFLQRLKDKEETTSKDSLQYWIDILSKENLCPESTSNYPYYNHTHISPSNPILAVNGRVFPITTSSIQTNDLDILLLLEKQRSSTLSSIVLKSSSSDVKIEENAKMVWKLSSYFSQLFGSKYSTSTSDVASSKKKRVNVIKVMDNAIDNYNKQEGTTMSSNDNPLQLKWNMNSSPQDNSNFKVQITVVLDPLTEPTQRITPILFNLLRDHLNAPFHLIFAPRLELNSEDLLPISSYYRFVAHHPVMDDNVYASFRNLPTNHVFTIQMDVPEPWNVQQSNAIQDTDNLRCVSLLGTGTTSSSKNTKFCGDYAYGISKLLEEDSSTGQDSITIDAQLLTVDDITIVEYELSGLLFFGQCYDFKSDNTMDPPNGLQLTLTEMNSSSDNTTTTGTVQATEVLPDGTTSSTLETSSSRLHYSDTLVMKNLGYWQIHANPGIWELNIAKITKGADMYDILLTDNNDSSSMKSSELMTTISSKKLVMKDFVNRGEFLLVKRRPEYTKLADNVLLGDISHPIETEPDDDDDDVIHVFSLATGHLYERLLKIMMLSVTKRTSSRVKFWLFENFLSPSFKSSATYMTQQIGCDIEFVTYKWPEWLRGQSEKQRIIWGYKILFLDVLFPLNVKKIIYVDADQVVRGDLKELWDYDLQGAPYGYVPFCTSREETLGYQFWRSGFWKSHLRHKPYHISALYVVDLHLFRQNLVGDKLRQTYQQLSADPSSLANLDQDLPNYAQHEVPIHSLPQEWLWCETWCSEETKAEAKTIDLCNNPEHKENKVLMAKRIVSGDLFPESWTELDTEVDQYNKDFISSLDETQNIV